MEKIFNQKIMNILKILIIISFYVKDQNYDKISGISKSTIADIENYREWSKFFDKKKL